MVAPMTPAPAKLFDEPPMTLGAPLVFGSRRSARVPFVFNSSGWLSVVPTKFAPGIEPTLPPRFQKLAAPNPPSETAFTLVKPVPLAEKLLGGLLKLLGLAQFAARF